MKLLGVAAVVVAASIAMARAEPADPYLWLEEVEGQRALDWVKAHNAKTMETIGAGGASQSERRSAPAASPAYQALKAEALTILTAKDRIPAPQLRGAMIYNLWQDDAHVKGVWRRTSASSYLSADPEWEVLVDIDALAKTEGVSWVFHGADCLGPDYKRCMVSLSNGGKDADTIREFDIPSKSFVAGGFALNEAKQDTSWLDKDTLLVDRALTSDEETTSGYARVVRRWERGKDLAAAPIIFTAEKEHVSAQSAMLEYGADRIPLLVRATAYYESEYSVLDAAGKLHDLPVPKDAQVAGYFAGELILALKSDWSLSGQTFVAGDYVSFKLAPVAASGAPQLKLLFHPSATQAAQSLNVAKDAVYVSYLDNVRGRVAGFRLKGQAWVGEAVALPELGAVEMTTSSSDDTRVFATYQDFLVPERLISWRKRGAAPQTIKTLPARFAADGLETVQADATSPDGTRIPYFLVRRAGAQGPQPTLLYGYGGFEVSYIPGQMPISQTIVGKLWLEKGGQFAVANIRGGGEFGPTWHTRILKERRQDVFDDFVAVAKDLIATGATSPAKIGIIGGSNGGLLVGAAMTQHPELFKAVVIDRPLLDMLRYHKLLAGASWIAEYGNPDIPEERAFIAAYSPYQHLDRSAKYPVPFIYASTRDDRVHPGHARKFAARLAEQGHKFYLFEQTEGGHSVGADPVQQANHYALEFAYLARLLLDGN
jgi:prolyl oligopeptidase